ncbi:class I SAM-dependent methyltransferase [Lewinella sp. IMCC34191]|uniref:class I SAM-dependent methyltransferase n=1 Tax=Lewinella sp. IMCC34191 TaxID=2259172 RepID=UPI000E238504|nr:class I SAM-dependent methyltransferase [Lewinella sp. IMCC34191]
MKKWVLKAVVQKAISYLPYKERINFFFQKYVTKGVELDDEHFGYKLEAARDHLRFYNKYATVPMAEATALELGTGWYPIVPTLLYLAGFDRVVSVDIRSWMTVDRQLIALRRILAYHADGRLARFVPDIRPDRLANLQRLSVDPPADIAAFNAAIHLDARIMDARQLAFDDDTFDLICSNNTFEHVYPDVLRGILLEFKRVWKSGGVMSHFVDLSDHFAHMDDRITIYNFLRFSAKEWARIDNDIQPQNRLRWPDYVHMYRDVGLPIREEEVRTGDQTALSRVPVHPEFAHLSPEALAISHGYLIS